METSERICAAVMAVATGVAVYLMIWPVTEKGDTITAWSTEAWPALVAIVAVSVVVVVIFLIGDADNVNPLLIVIALAIGGVVVYNFWDQAYGFIADLSVNRWKIFIRALFGWVTVPVAWVILEALGHASRPATAAPQQHP